MNEPYFNEAGYERQKGTQQGHENSRMYNEMVVLKMVQAMTRLALHPPEAFKDEIQQHLKEYAQRYVCEIISGAGTGGARGATGSPYICQIS